MGNIDNLDIGAKYKKWLKLVTKSESFDKDLHVLLEKHSRLIEKLPIEFRDIFRFKSVDDFEGYMCSVDSSTNDERVIKENGSKEIYSDENYDVKHIFTRSAMEIYGAGSRWCISSKQDNQWDTYESSGNIFFLVTSKKLPYSSVFKKFVVQLQLNNRIIIWDRLDNQYDGNVLDLIGLDGNLFHSVRYKETVDKLLKYINDKTIVDILTKNNAIIAGGALLSITNNTEVNDIDVWFKNVTDYNTCLYGFKEYVNGSTFDLIENLFNFNSMVETKYSFTFNVDNNGKTVKYQLIKPDRYIMGELPTIINQFDLKCVMCGIDMSKRIIHSDKRFYVTAIHKNLEINENLRNRGNILTRIIKYSNRGFRISHIEKNKALRILASLTDKEIEDASMY
jgi:hypothetical protein